MRDITYRRRNIDADIAFNNAEPEVIEK